MQRKLFLGDNIKARSQETIRHFCKEHLPRGRELSALILAGPEALDVTRVLDPLGVKRRNVVGIENDHCNYGLVHNLGLGIDLGKGPRELQDYLEETTQRFDIMLLDFNQTYGFMQQLIVNLVAARNLLLPGGVLYTNFYVGREGDLQKRRYGRISETRGEEREDPIHLSRSEAITFFTLDALASGTDNIRPNGFFKTTQIAANVLEELRRDYPNIPDETIQASREFRQGLQSGIYNYFGSRNIPVQVAKMLIWASNRRYFVTDLYRYQYTGQTGATMYSDLFQVSDGSKTLGPLSDLVSMDKGNLLFLDEGQAGMGSAERMVIEGVNLLSEFEPYLLFPNLLPWRTNLNLAGSERNG